MEANDTHPSATRVASHAGRGRWGEIFVTPVVASTFVGDKITTPGAGRAPTSGIAPVVDLVPRAVANHIA